MSAKSGHLGQPRHLATHTNMHTLSSGTTSSSMASNATITPLRASHYDSAINVALATNRC